MARNADVHASGADADRDAAIERFDQQVAPITVISYAVDTCDDGGPGVPSIVVEVRYRAAAHAYHGALGSGRGQDAGR
jgi:hypothetical protein